MVKETLHARQRGHAGQVSNNTRLYLFKNPWALIARLADGSQHMELVVQPVTILLGAP